MSERWPAFSLNSTYIYTGSWTNWNDEYANGGRITTTKKAADLIMIFTGILFVFMESGLCSLVAFALFWYHGRRQPLAPSDDTADPALASVLGNRTRKLRDSVWHQRQTVLRNSEDFLSIAGRSISIWLAYRRLKPRLTSRVLRTALLAFVTSCLFLVALPFLTAFVMLHEEGNEVLIRSDGCGLYDTPKGSNATDHELRTEDVTSRWHTAIQYVDACYAIDTPSELCDNYFVKRKLKSNQDPVECPFEKAVCLGEKDKPGVRIRTADLDSHTDLGLNAEPGDRIQFNREAKCVPIDLSKPRSSEDSGWMDARLGRIHDQYDVTFSGYNGSGAYLQRYTLHGYEGGVEWDPIPELVVPDAYTSIVFLHNPQMLTEGKGGGPCEDPFFYSTVRDETSEWYLPDKPVTAVGCVEQFTFTNPQNTDMTKTVIVPWSNLPEQDRLKNIETETSAIGDALDLNSKQRATVQLTLWGLANAGTIGEMIGTVGVSALRANKSPGTYFRFQNPLPDDQWIIETQYWVDIGLAALQEEFVRFATGPLNSEGLIPGPEEAKNEVCNLQKIKHSEFENFRRPGLISLATIGGFLVLAPWLAIRLTIWLGRRKGWKFVLEWISYGELQLLRMANEGAGVQGWQGCDEEVPFVDAEEIAHIDLNNLKHPRMIHAPSTEMGAADQASIYAASTTRLIT